VGRTLRSSAYEALIEALRNARVKAGLTQQAVADALGVPQSYVAKIEVGERRVDVVELLDLLDVVNADWKSVIRKVDKARNAS